MPRVIDASRAMRRTPVKRNRILVLSACATDSHFSPEFREYAEKEVARLLAAAEQEKAKKRKARKRSTRSKT